MDNTFKLSEKVTFNGETLTEVTFRKPLLADMLAADRVEGEKSKEAAIYASVCGVSFDLFIRIEAADYMTIVAKADAFAGEASAPAPEVTGAESQG